MRSHLHTHTHTFAMPATPTSSVYSGNSAMSKPLGTEVAPSSTGSAPWDFSDKIAVDCLEQFQASARAAQADLAKQLQRLQQLEITVKSNQATNQQLRSEKKAAELRITGFEAECARLRSSNAQKKSVLHQLDITMKHARQPREEAQVHLKDEEQASRAVLKEFIAGGVELLRSVTAFVTQPQSHLSKAAELELREKRQAAAAVHEQLSSLTATRDALLLAINEKRSAGSHQRDGQLGSDTVADRCSMTDEQRLQQELDQLLTACSAAKDEHMAHLRHLQQQRDEARLELRALLKSHECLEANVSQLQAQFNQLVNEICCTMCCSCGQPLFNAASCGESGHAT